MGNFLCPSGKDGIVDTSRTNSTNRIRRNEIDDVDGRKRRGERETEPDEGRGTKRENPNSNDHSSTFEYAEKDNSNEMNIVNTFTEYVRRCLISYRIDLPLRYRTPDPFSPSLRCALDVRRTLDVSKQLQNFEESEEADIADQYVDIIRTVKMNAVVLRNEALPFAAFKDAKSLVAELSRVEDEGSQKNYVEALERRICTNVVKKKSMDVPQIVIPFLSIAPSGK